ncbi:hypothetical protein CANCADRAFT_14931, partial [Tortispora caseinolytica NRRL Y-17796]
TKPIPGDSPVLLCDAQSKQILDVQLLNVLPNPPEAGKNITVEAYGTLSQTIEKGAYVELNVRYGMIQLIKQTVDLCDELKHVDKKCPIEKGPVSFLKEIALPDAIPPGIYSVVAQAYTYDDQEIACVTATVKF